MKNILITGSNGFVGKNLVEFYNSKYNVITYTRSDNLEEILSINKPEIIINCAAEIYNEENMFSSNLELTHKLINYVIKTKSKLIHIGSSSEYGRKEYPSSEKDRLDPTTPYEATKGAATLMCVGYAKYYKLPIVVARPYSVYGKYEKDYRLFTSIYNAYINNKKMTLYDGYHDFIYIKDFINGLDILLNSDNEKISGDVVNFGSGIQYSNYDVLMIFNSIFGYIPDCIEVNKKMIKPFESSIWLCDTRYSKEKYNFETQFLLKEGVLDLLKERGYVI
jgi:nucleoside-diphosphate-sugar epimerase